MDTAEKQYGNIERFQGFIERQKKFTYTAIISCALTLRKFSYQINDSKKAIVTVFILKKYLLLLYS